MCKFDLVFHGSGLLVVAFPPFAPRAPGVAAVIGEVLATCTSPTALFMTRQS
ncbi:hypothetical protein ACH4FX_20645 [Streptomyces sp. NPDC018019]|uniref:hypothetical protein n=1 Tax=Streptomyces sp. NPDC018019 TaxID=3365030 RepID=UPI003787633A